MQSSDLSLIKLNTTHYFIKTQTSNRIEYKDRLYFDKFQRVDEPLSYSVIQDHWSGKITVAHSLINSRDRVENIVIDYNGRTPERFWHRAQLILRNEGFINFTAYETKTPNHLHLYIHKGHTTLNEACQIGNKISTLLSQKILKEWRVFPTLDLPREFNILTLPYEVYQKERGAGWSKHM